MSEEKAECGKELSSEFIDEVSTMLEKLKEKIGKCEGQTNNPSLNFDSCEDFPPKNETEVLNLISKLQNTLDNISQPPDTTRSQSEDDNSLDNADSKIESSESRGETPTVCSEGYEANSEYSSDEGERIPAKTRNFSKDVTLNSKISSTIHKDHVFLSSSGSNHSNVEVTSDQKPHISNRRRNSKQDALSMLSLAIVNCKSREELVEKNQNSSDGQFPHLVDSESDVEEILSPITKKKRELPWKIRAAKKRMEHLNRSDHSINEISNHNWKGSKSTDTINNSSQDVTHRSYIHSKSAGSITNVLNSTSLTWPEAQENLRALKEMNVHKASDQNAAPATPTLPANYEDSDSCDDEGDVFSVKPITANFLSQQEHQENREKNRLPFGVRTNEVLKISERFSKPQDNSEIRPLDKAPRKKVYGPIENVVKVKPEVKTMAKERAETKVITKEKPNGKPINKGKYKLDLPQNILSPKSDVPIIRGFQNNEETSFNCDTDKTVKGRVASTDKPHNSQNVVDNTILGNSKSYENELNRNKSYCFDVGYELSKSKSTPICFKSANYPGKITWNVIEDSSRNQNTSLKPCFTYKKEKVKTNMVSEIQTKFEEQRYPVKEPISTEKPKKELDSDKIDWIQMQDICNDPSILLFTPEQLLKIAIHKAAINKQLSTDPGDINILRTTSVSEAVPDKPSLHHTLSLDGHILPTPLSISEIFTLSGNQSRPNISDTNNSDTRDDPIIPKTNGENHISNEFNDISSINKINQRCISGPVQVEEETVSSKKETPMLFNTPSVTHEMKHPIQSSLNTVPKSYVKTEDHLSSDIFMLPTNIANSKNESHFISDTKLASSNTQNNYSFLNKNTADISSGTVNEIKVHSSKPILKRQDRHHSIEDAAQLLNNTVSQRKQKEREIKTKNRSNSANSPEDSSPSMKKDVNPIKTSDLPKSSFQNILQDQVQKNLDELPKQPIEVFPQDLSIQTEKSRQLPQNVSNNTRGRSKSLFTISNENNENSFQNNTIMKPDIIKQYLKQENTTEGTKLEKLKTVDNSSNIIPISHQMNSSPFNPLNTEALQKRSLNTSSKSSQDEAFASSREKVSSTLLSSPEAMDQKKRKPNYTDFIVPPLPTSAHKISQLESRSNPLSPTPSVTHSTGACSDKDFRDSQESDKLNKVSDTWISAAKSPTTITSSKPWTKENNKTIRGQYVKKNKDKLLQTNENCTQNVDNSNNIDYTRCTNKKPAQNHFEKQVKSDNKVSCISKKSPLESISKSNRVKNISNKFKIFSDSNKNQTNLAHFETTKHKDESFRQSKNIAHVNCDNDTKSSTNGQKLTNSKPHKKENKNYIARICNEIFKGNTKTVNTINTANTNSNTNKRQHKELVQLPEINNKEIKLHNVAPFEGEPHKMFKGKENMLNSTDTNVGPTIHKLSKTNEAFKNITKQIDKDQPSSSNLQTQMSSEKKNAAPSKKCSNWENKIKVSSEAGSTSSWKISPSNKSVVKKNKSKIESKNSVIENKMVERNCTSDEFKSVMSNFEQKKKDSSKVEKISSPVPITRRQRTLLEKSDNKDPSFPLRLSKSCTFRHSSFEPLINVSPPNADVSVIKRQKPKDSHSVKFSKIVENLEHGEPNPIDGLSLSRKHKPTNRNRPKSICSSSPVDKKCSLINQFPWNKEVGRLPLCDKKAELKAIAEDTRRKMESYFKSSPETSSKSFPTKPSSAIPKDSLTYRTKTRIKSNSSSERSSIYDSWEHLVSNTDYNSQLVDELFSETVLKDIELSDSSLSRRRFSDFSVESNESNSEVYVGSKLARSQTFSHNLYREKDKKIVPFNHATSSYTTLCDSSIKGSSKARAIGDHEKARKTLLKLATLDDSPANKSEHQVNAYEGLVNQSSFVGKGTSAFNKFKQIDGQQSRTTSGPQVAGPLFALSTSLNRSASGVKDMIMTWCQCRTRNYKGVKIENFSTSWNDGLAFCALIHHFYPDAFNFDALNPKNRRYNFALAFRTADERADVYPLLDVEDMVAMQKPDWKCVFTYVQTLYKRLKDE